MKKYFFFSIICIALAVLPSLHIFPSLIIYDEKRLLQVVILLFVGLAFVGKAGTRLISSLLQEGNGADDHTCDSLILPPFVQWGIVLFMVLGLLSVWVNGSWYRGSQELSLYALLLLFFLYSAKTYLQNPLQFKKGVWLLLLLFSGLYALKFFIGYGMFLLQRYPVWPGRRFEATVFGYVNVRFFNQIQVWTLPLFIIWAVDTNNGKKYLRWLFLFVASFWWCLIIASAGRGATLSLLVAPCLSLLLFKEKSHKYIKVYLPAFFTGVLLKFFLFDFLARGGMAKTLARGGTGRLDRWGKMIFDIIDKPLLGFGPMSFALINNQYHAGHPHNSILQITYEFGIPAMLIVVGLIVYGLYNWFNQSLSSQLNISQYQTDLRIGISTSLLAGLGYSLFSGVIVMPLSQLWMVLIAGWALGIYIKKTKSCTNTGLIFQNWLSKGLFIGAIIFMCYSIISDVPKLKETQQYYRDNYGHIYHPRFWQQGKIGLKKD